MKNINNIKVCKSYGKLIKNYRKEHNLSQSEFAKNIDPKILASQISGWESGKHSPSFEYIIALQQLGIAISDAINDVIGVNIPHPHREPDYKTQRYRLNDNKINYYNNSEQQNIKIIDENGNLGRFNIEQIFIKYLALDSADNITFYKNRGNALHEISDGDIVALENVLNDSFRIGGIYLLNSNFGLLLLRYVLSKGKYKFVSAYHECPIEDLKIERSWQVIKVISLSAI